MVIKGASRRSIGFWSRHLSDDKKNDRAEIVENRGLAGDNLRDMMSEMQQDARITRAQNFMYIASFNPCAHEHLTEQQWERVYEIFEMQRGIPPGQQRIVVEHEKNGRTHRHVVWNRIDTERMRAFPDGHDLKVCDAAEKQIERELGLERTPHFYDREPGIPQPVRGPKSWEMYRGQRSEIDPRDVTAEVTGIFQESENAADFVAGLRQHGYEMVKGNRAFCIMDPAGDVHSLARRIDGVNTKELKAFMRGLDLSSLPSIEQSKARHQELKIAGLEADRATVQHEIAWEEGLAKAAIEKEKIERRFVEPEPERNANELGGREKESPRSPFGPPHPISEPHPQLNKTAPEHWFEDVAQQVTRPEPIPEPPENFKGAARHIWTAWHHSDTPRAFTAALGEHGISLAAVTKDEVDRSHRQAEFAKAVGNFAPRYREGEIVAVSPQGQVYKLTERTTGEKPANIEKFLAKLDRSQLKGIEGTRQAIQDRAELRDVERQAFRDLSGIGLLTPEKDRAGGRKDPKPGIERDVSVAPLKGAAGKALETVANIASEAIEMLGDMFGATEMTEERIQAILEAREQRAEQFEIDLKRLHADEDHDRRTAREREITEQHEHERQETERKRDRERDR